MMPDTGKLGLPYLQNRRPDFGNHLYICQNRRGKPNSRQNDWYRDSPRRMGLIGLAPFLGGSLLTICLDNSALCCMYNVADVTGDMGKGHYDCLDAKLTSSIVLEWNTNQLTHSFYTKPTVVNKDS